MKTFCCISLAILLTSTPSGALAQTPAPAQNPDRISSGTTEVLLDAVVKDKKGKPVKDLKASDFQITEDGVPQEIRSFRLVSGDDEAAPAAAPLKRADAIRKVRADFNAGRIGAVALVFDRLALDSRKLAHDAALTYADVGQANNDFIGVYAIDQSLSVFQTFTNDRQLIRKAIDRAGTTGSSVYSSNLDQIRALAERQMVLDSQVDQTTATAGQATAATAAGAIGANEVDRALNRMALASAQGFEHLEALQQGHETMDGLLAIISAMGAMPGRKAVVFFSEGLLLPDSVMADFRTVIANANRANVSIYTVDAAGLRAESADAKSGRAMTVLGQQRAAQAGSANDSFGSMMRDSERNEALIRHNPDSGLGQLSDQTGGFLVSGTNNPGARLRQVNDELHTYYVLSYSPSNRNFDGKFRQIGIKINRGGTEVQTRKGYFGLPNTYDSPVLPYEAPALAILGRASQPNAFASKAAAFSFPLAGPSGLVPVLVSVPASAINFASDTAKNSYHADFSIVALIKDDQRVVRKVSNHYVLNGPLDQLERARRANILFYRETNLDPGEYTIESIVYDASNNQVSLNRGALSVPDTDATKLRVSNLIIVDKSQKAAANDPAENPFRVGDLILYPNLGEPLHKTGNKGLSMFMTVYAAKGAGAPKMSIELSQAGKPLGQLPVQLPAADAQGRIQYTGTIPLDAFPAGEYDLKAIVSDGSGTATRSEHFTVQP